MAGLTALADSERAALSALADRDSAAFEAVMAAHRMPRRSDEERAARTVAIQSALTGAAEVPLEVARRAAALLPTARELVETGNVNAVSDAFSAGHLLHTGVAGGLANVSVNLAAMTDAAQIEGLRGEAQWVREGAAAQLAAVEAAFTARLSGTS